LLANPELATRRMKAVLALRGNRGVMRDFSADHRWLSLNTATVRKQGDLLQIIEACARHGIRAHRSLARPGRGGRARARGGARCTTLGSSCRAYCRGGMFTADAGASRRGARR